METLFAKIVRKEIPADIVYEDEDIVAFRDIHPVAPTHILLIPKATHLAKLSAASPSDSTLLGKLMLAANKVAKQEGLTDFRIVINNGEGAGQSVFHLHVHLIGGRALSWPPG